MLILDYFRVAVRANFVFKTFMKIAFIFYYIYITTEVSCEVPLHYKVLAKLAWSGAGR